MRSWMRGPGAVTGALVVVAGAYLVGTAPGRGVYWDEHVQSVYGRNVIQWFASGFEDRSALEQGNLILYGGTIETALELAAAPWPEHRYLVRHVAVGLIGLVGVVGVFRLGSALAVPWAGALGAFLLLIHPRFFGHMFFNSKDVPFAAAYVWILALFVRDVRRPIGAPLRSALPLAICLGILFGTRVGGVIVMAPLVLGYAMRWWQSGRGRRTAVHLLARLGTLAVVSHVVMIAAWPWAQQRPFLHPVAALLANGKFPWNYPQLFDGAFVDSVALPLVYLPTWFLISTPEVILLGLVALAAALVLRPTRALALKDPAAAAVATAAILPVAYVMGTHAALYDGPRHLLFVQPFVALASALGFVLLASSRADRGRPGAWVVAGVVASAAVLPARSMLALRPYEYVYFNHLSGGLPAADGRYELDYWGLSYREGVEWLAANPPEPGPIRVASCSHPESTRPFVRPPLEFVGSPLFEMSAPGDVLLYASPHDCVFEPPWTRPEGRVLHRVERWGVPLLTVFDPLEPYESEDQGAGYLPATLTAPGSPPAPDGSPRDGRSSDPSNGRGPGGGE